MKINVFTETRHHAEREGDPGQRDQQGAEDDGPRRARPVRHQDQVSFSAGFSTSLSIAIQYEVCI